MTDLTHEIAETATVAGECALGALEGGAKGAITGIAAGAATASLILTTSAAASTPALLVTGASAPVVPEAVLFTAAALGVGGAVVGAAKGCHNNVEQHYQQVLNKVAEKVSADERLSHDEKTAMIEQAARRLLDSEQSIELSK